MKSFRFQKAAIAVFFAAFAFCASIQAQQHTLRARHIPDVVRNGHASAVGQLETDHPLHLVINLPLRNEDALDALLQQLYDPSSPNFHHFLSSQQFADAFSPSQADYDKVVAWAKTKGLQVTSTTVNRRLVEVEGPAGTINRAFNVLLKTYKDTQTARTFHAPDREPTVDLAVPLLAISGLDDANPPHNHLKKCEEVARPAGTIAENATPVEHSGGSAPGGYFLPSDMRAAYYGTGPLTGAGQTVAIFSFDDFITSDLNVYYTNTGMTTTVPVNTVHVNGYNTPCWGFNSNGTINYNTCDDTEQILDIVNVQGMAPGLTQVLFYVNLSANSVLNQIAIDNTASVITSSWGGGDFGSASDFYFKEFQAQGQTYFNATGDLGQFNSSTYDPPSVDANITQVGGTDLVTMGAGGPWSSETGWADSGGGYFTGTAIPAWQQLTGVINASNQGSTTLRNAPDVAAEGNFDNPSVDNGVYKVGFGGTSFAAPRWAGYMALVNQQAALNGNGRVGFLNPTIYNIGVNTNYTNNFHDITSGKNAPGAGSGSGFNAVTGYDLVTGWGSPNAALLNTLASMTAVPDFSFAASPNPINIAQGSSGTTTVTITDLGGFTGAVALSASTLPTGVTASFSPASTTSTSVLTLTVASSVSSGVKGITLTGTWGGVTHTVSLSLNVTSSPDYSLSASPASVTAVQGGGTSSTITVTPLNSFTGAVALSASGLPTGVTASFSPASATTSSTLTLTASSTATLGQATVTITGTSGSLTHATTVSLTVIAPADYGLSATAANVVQGATGTSTVSVTPLNGFSGAVALSASGLPAGVTAMFSPSSATTTSTLTLTASSTATVGSSLITLTGTSGSLTHTATFTLTVTAAPDYSLSATTASVVQGASGTSAITVTPLNSFNGAVALMATGLPAGVTASFSPASATTNSTLTLTASSTATVGSALITVIGTSGSLTHTATFTLTVTASPDYSLSATPASVMQGASGTSAITVTPLNSFNGAVALTATGLPAGVTASFSPASATTSSTLTLTASSTATVGSALITVTGTSGSLTHTATFTLTVTAAPDYSLSATSASVVQGATGTSTVTVTPLNSFSGVVALTASGLPAGVTASFSPASATTSSTLTLTASSTATVGTATITLTGTSGSLTHTTTVAMTVTAAPDYLLSATSASVVQGASVTSAITVNALNSFSGSVTLSATGLPAGVTASFSPASATTSSTLTLTASSTATVGPATITVTGTSGSLTHTATFTLTVTAAPDYSLSATSASVVQGATGTSAITVNALNSFTGSVALTASGLPAGVTASFSPASATTGSTLTLTALSTATPGSSTVTITGTSGSLTHATTFTLTVTGAPDYSLSASPVSIAQGASGGSSIAVTGVNGFSGLVGLSASGLPAGVTASFSPATATSTSTLTFTASSTATTGTAIVTVTGTSGSLTHSTTLALTVTASAAVDPAFAIIPIAEQINGVAPFSVGFTSLSSGAVTFSVLSGPATVTGNTVKVTGTGTVVLQASQAAAGNYTAATATTSFIVIAKALAPGLAFVPVAGQPFSNTPIALGVTSSSTGAVTYSVASGPATVSGSLLTLTGIGKVSLSVTQAASTPYAAATATTSFTVSAEAAGLTLAAVPDHTFGDAPFTVSATTLSPAPIVYSVTSGKASVSGNTVTLSGSGTIMVAAKQAASGNFAAASTTTTFNVAPGDPGLTFTPVPDASVGQQAFVVTASSPSFGAITYTVLSGPATVYGHKVTVTAIGTVVLQATQAASGSYTAGTATTSFTVGAQRITPTLTLSIPNQLPGAPTFAIAAVSNSPGAITYAITSGPATIAGNLVTVTGLGTVTVTATQVGTSVYSSATAVATFTVAPLAPTLVIAPIATQPLSNAVIPVSVTSNSAGAITVSVSGPAVFSGSSLTMTGLGKVTITATQVASSPYSAITVTSFFNVTAALPNLTLTAIPDHTFGDAAFTVSATSLSPAPIVYSVSVGKASVSGSTVTLSGSGSVTITAKQAATTNYAAATTTTSFNVAAGNPNLTFTPIPDQKVGALAFVVTASSPSFGAITYTVVSGPATVYGHKVTVTGVGTVTLQATQAASGSYTAGTATTSFNVTQP